MRTVGTRGLRVPPPVLHDDRHRRLGRSAGRLILKRPVDKAALDHRVVLEKRLMPPLDDLLLGKRGDLPVARPLKRLRVKREPLGIKRAASVDFADLRLQVYGQPVSGNRFQDGGEIGKRGRGRHCFRPRP